MLPEQLQEGNFQQYKSLPQEKKRRISNKPPKTRLFRKKGERTTLEVNSDKGETLIYWDNHGNVHGQAFWQMDEARQKKMKAIRVCFSNIDRVLDNA